MSDLTIWKPVEFDPAWMQVDTKKFDNISPSWIKKREEFSSNPIEYEKFLDKLKRKQAIDTGIVERMYNLKEGITETFIKDGFVESALQHGDTDIEPNLLMKYLRDNFEAIDLIFDFVKNNRSISTGFVKELHSLITRNQVSTEAIDQFGIERNIPLLSGEYKQMPNNPQRDGVVYQYCPPEQVASQMDELIKIYSKLRKTHILVKAAFFHHAFVQIHPFQDGNGRIARLLASFVLIKDNFFPFTLDRTEKVKYIKSLEFADTRQYQPLIDIFMENQIRSIERALNLRTVEPEQGYDSVVVALSGKIDSFIHAAEDAHNRDVAANMNSVYSMLLSKVESNRQDLSAKIGNRISINVNSCPPDDEKCYYYSKQIIDYANLHDYYFNTSYSKAWIRISFQIADEKRYNFFFSLHHYGYDNNTFAIGSFISYEIDEERAAIDSELIRKGKEKYYRDIPSELSPLTASSDKNGYDLEDQIEKYVQDCFVVALAYISNDL